MTNNIKEDDVFWLNLIKNVRPLKKTLDDSDIKIKKIKTKISPISKPLINSAKEIKEKAQETPAILDLHGLTEDEAYEKLVVFVDKVIADNYKSALIITGKGKDGLGVLKQMVPKWLLSKKFKNKIISFNPAPVNKGGSGALVLLLKSSKRIS